MFMVLSSWQSHCESSPGSFDECRTAPSGRRHKTKPDDLAESACAGCQSLHPPSPCIIITQLNSWYLFYHPTEGRRLSQPSWLVTCQSNPPSPFIIITQLDSWYLFYRPRDGRRLSQPSWLVTCQDDLPIHRWFTRLRQPIPVLTGSDVVQLRWLRPTRYHKAKPPTNVLSVLL